MSKLQSVTDSDFETWANDFRGSVALHLNQRLLPVEGEGAVFFPPTFAGVDGGYDISTLSDGTKVATVDSVGSQANRMEPLFKSGARHQADPELTRLVPQVTVDVGAAAPVSLLDAGHRLGDALIRSSSIGEQARAAFLAFLDQGDAGPLAKLGPTSLVFGAWDSRGTQAKFPRLVQSTIRAYDVSPLTRHAVYVPPVDYEALGVITEEDKKKAEKDNKSPAAQKGFVHVPAEGAGGVIARGEIRREVTVNLIALRRLDSPSDGEKLRTYLLGLALVAATAPMDGFLRQGCLLTPHPQVEANWVAVERDGKRVPLQLTAEVARKFATQAAERFGVSKDIAAKFSKDRAAEDLKVEGAKPKGIASEKKGKGTPR